MAKVRGAATVRLNARPSTSYVLWRLISIASDPLWVLPYRAQIATGFATQLNGTGWDGERYKNEKSGCFQDDAGDAGITRDGGNRISRPLP